MSFCNFPPIHQKFPVLCLFYKKTEISRTVILSYLWKDIYKHLLLFKSSKRHIIFNLRPFQAYVIKGTDNDILRLCLSLNLKFFPFHIIHPAVLNAAFIPFFYILSFITPA